MISNCCCCEVPEEVVVDGVLSCIRCGRPLTVPMSDREHAAILNYLDPATPIRKYGRNNPCFCGSGLKYKQCCGV